MRAGRVDAAASAAGQRHAEAVDVADRGVHGQRAAGEPAARVADHAAGRVHGPAAEA